jgi:hypothetical protein
VTKWLWYWMAERHRIYLRRQAGEKPPWTKDTILQEIRFCNVFRELDTVTVWVRKNIREPYADHPALMFMLALARVINWPPTLQHLMDEGLWPDLTYRQDDIRLELEDRLSMNLKVYTGAYMIRAEAGRTKAEYLCDVVLPPLWENLGKFAFVNESLEQAWGWLCQFHGWGPFMSYELVTDLRHTRYLKHAPDINTWACAGPGALRGLNRIEGKPLKAPRSQEDACERMRELLESEESQQFDYEFDVWLEMRDIEHSLCEMDKYLRVMEGGQTRAKYVYGRGY